MPIEFNNDLAKLLLKSAINDYLGYRMGHEYHRDAQDWLFTDFDEDEEDRQEHSQEGFISLFTTCEILEINHEKLRIWVKCREDEGKKRIVDSQLEAILTDCGL